MRYWVRVTEVDCLPVTLCYYTGALLMCVLSIRSRSFSESMPLACDHHKGFSGFSSLEVR